MTAKEYQIACNMAATLVAEFGDKYLPVFKLAHEAMLALEIHSQLKLLALNISKQSQQSLTEAI